MVHSRPVPVKTGRAKYGSIKTGRAIYGSIKTGRDIYGSKLLKLRGLAKPIDVKISLVKNKDYTMALKKLDNLCPMAPHRAPMYG